MIQEFEPVAKGILARITEWEPRLSALPENLITRRKNSQGRTIKQIFVPGVGIPESRKIQVEYCRITGGYRNNSYRYCR